MNDTEITDVDVVSAMIGTARAALAAHTLRVVDAENVAEGSVLLGMLHDDPNDRAGLELFAQPITIGTAADADAQGVAVYGRGAITLAQDPREGYDVLTVAGTQKLIVRVAA